MIWYKRRDCITATLRQQTWMLTKMSNQPILGSYCLMDGNVLDVLPLLLPESFDACFCDPPYGLKFMGQSWDHGVPSVEIWREVFRVLKPGALLMAFGGTRTYHRLTCAIEDAGFEIRDCLMWLYGQGFPKSTDISKQIDKRGGNPHLAKIIGEKIRRARESRGLTVKYCDDHFCDGTTNWTWFEGRPAGQRPPTSDCFNKITAEWPELADLRSAIEEAEREIIGRSEHKSGIGNNTTGHYTVGGTIAEYTNMTAPATDNSSLWSGYGTALKPAWEPIILAMKPCEGTFAQNALTHGVAGLNIDESRIGTQGEQVPFFSTSGGQKYTLDGRPQQVRQVGTSTSGRWPANLLLSHTPWCVETGAKQVRTNMASSGDAKENHLFGYGTRQPGRRGHADENGLETVAAFECHPLCPVRLLDEQAGNRGGGFGKEGRVSSKCATDRFNYGYSGESKGKIVGFGDSGGASRFFYTAKVSTGERNLGNIDCRHPTLKPISLCSYLSTLLLPPSRDSNSRRLLVPFSGAGSEMIGALLAGWDEVHGIEIDPQYLTWAEARISAAMRGEMRGEAPSKEGNQDDNQEGGQDRRKGRGRTPTLSTEALDVLGDILS